MLPLLFILLTPPLLLRHAPVVLTTLGMAAGWALVAIAEWLLWPMRDGPRIPQLFALSPAADYALIGAVSFLSIAGILWLLDRRDAMPRPGWPMAAGLWALMLAMALPYAFGFWNLPTSPVPPEEIRAYLERQVRVTQLVTGMSFAAFLVIICSAGWGIIGRLRRVEAES